MRPLLAAPPDGFRGQLARLSVHIEELLLPGGDEVLLERPKIAKYTASYRLPGEACWLLAFDSKRLDWLHTCSI